MKSARNKSYFLLSVLIFLSALLSAQTEPTYPLSAYKEGLHNGELFDFNWKFHRGGAQGAEMPSFDDSNWRKIDLPHDWSIEDLPGTNSPFSIDAITQVNGGFTTGGTGWYRKTFPISEKNKDKNFIIVFEGAYMNAEVWLNGTLLGNHPYGYTSFDFDLTGKLRYDKENVIAVKIRNEGENSRWYSGSGIYRHVWLKAVAPVHIETWGTYITTPVINEKETSVHIRTSVVNNSPEESTFTLITRIVNSDGYKLAEISTNQTLSAGKKIGIDQDLKLPDPSLWSPESPRLYVAESEIIESGSIIDRSNMEFGVRSISFDAANGFLLNGKPMKLKGGCVHHDNGILGARAYDRAEERRVELLKASGFNAIRCAHNPPSPAFLRACDHLGMLVIDEAFDMWKDGKNPADYHLYFNDWWKKDIQSMVQRDRNHPSIILWSIGNEIPDRTNPEVIRQASELAEMIRTLDPTRPVTSAVNDLKPDKDPYFAVLDVGGYNYPAVEVSGQRDSYAIDHDRLPQRIMVGTESFPLEAFGSWMAVRDHPYVIGDFVWTSFDYIGEASIGWRGYLQKQDFFPWNLAYCGDIDICGWKRPQSYYRDVLWKENMISIWITPPTPSFPVNGTREKWSKWHWFDAIADWNWQGYEGRMMEVNVYSSCGEAELFINNRSAGKKITDRTSAYIAKWLVPYEPGILKATGFSGRKRVAEYELHTASAPLNIKLSADRDKIRSDGQDLSYITVELMDNGNNLNPKAENMISFEIEGPGTITGVGNANPESLESFQLPRRKAWHGKCMVVIKSGIVPGKITLRASADGLKSGSIVIDSRQDLK